jgi:ABC-2 type transport system ATP-binding protein
MSEIVLLLVDPVLSQHILRPMTDPLAPTTRATPPNPALEAIDLSKRYRRGTLALDDVTLEVASGSITALVGPNAAGKSTLIKTWVGFERPTAGSVRVRGIDPWRDRAGALSQLGYVPQQPALYRGLSVADHLDVAAHVRRGFDRAAAADHLDRLGIARDARPTALSGGQQAQVMLAVALGTGADVLLLDEPLASLDPLARSEFLALLRSAVRERGATALLSSHIVTDIEQVCDRLIVLGIGHVLLDDSLATALAGHRIRVGGGDADGRLVDVGSFPDDAGAPLALVHAAHDAGPDALDGRRDLRRATLDEIVKGYLVAGRRLHAERAA